MNSYEEFVLRRNRLLRPNSNQTARELASDIVTLFQEIAVHASSGIQGDARKEREYIDILERRIVDAKTG